MKYFNKDQKDTSLIEARKVSARLPEILLQAQKTAQSLMRGEHGRRKTGSGDHFWQYRSYDPLGDAASRIDWRRSARSDHLFVRELEEERPHTACFWVDPSSSMHYASVPKKLKTKYEYAFTATCVLAYLLTQRGERVKAAGQGGIVATHPKDVTRWAEAVVNSSSSPLFEGIRHSRLFLAGDFLQMSEQEMLQLKQAAVSNGNIVTVLVPVDPAERLYPFEGHVKFETLEGERSFETQNAKSLKNDYLSRLAAHQEKLKKLFGKENVFFLNTDAPLEASCLDVVKYLMM